jgi:hypothetical protein
MNDLVRCDTSNCTRRARAQHAAERHARDMRHVACAKRPMSVRPIGIDPQPTEAMQAKPTARPVRFRKAHTAAAVDAWERVHVYARGQCPPALVGAASTLHLAGPPLLRLAVDLDRHRFLGRYFDFLRLAEPRRHAQPWDEPATAAGCQCQAVTHAREGSPPRPMLPCHRSEELRIHRCLCVCTDLCQSQIGSTAHADDLQQPYKQSRI